MEVSDDSLTDFVTCIPSGKSSRTDVMGMYARKYLVVLEAFLESGMLSEGDMTEKGGVKLSREEMCEKTEGLRLESFIRGLFPSIKPILMPKALIRASRILIGARHLAGGCFEAIEMAGDAFIDVFVLEYWIHTLPGSSASELDSLRQKCTNRGVLAAAAANICLESHIHYDLASN
ncbi:hypothetical protein BGZ46_004964, partial [Entomortierella lignicola]